VPITIATRGFRALVHDNDTAANRLEHGQGRCQARALGAAASLLGRERNFTGP
jgi:hypothetical protein